MRREKLVLSSEARGGAAKGALGELLCSSRDPHSAKTVLATTPSSSRVWQDLDRNTYLALTHLENTEGFCRASREKARYAGNQARERLAARSTSLPSALSAFIL